MLLRTFVGGARDPRRARAARTRSWSTRSIAALTPLLGIRGEPLLTRVYRWERGKRAARGRSPRARWRRSTARSARHPGSVRHRQRLPRRRDSRLRRRRPRDGAGRWSTWLAHDRQSMPSACTDVAQPAASAALSATVGAAPAQPSTRRCPPDVAARCSQQIKAADTDQLAVSEEDGRFLRVMVAASGATRALEIGGANGYSAIWIGLGLRETGGRLTTIEYDPARATVAAENIRTRRPRRHRHGRAGRRVQGDPEARRRPSTSSSSTPGSATTSGSSTWCCPRLAPARPLPRAQRRQQAERDARLPRRDQDMTPRLLTTIVSPSGEGMSVSLQAAE